MTDTFENETTEGKPTGGNETTKNQAKIILVNEDSYNTIIEVAVHPVYYMDDGKEKQYYKYDKNYYIKPVETNINKGQPEEFAFTARLYPSYENKNERVNITLRFKWPISENPIGYVGYILSDSVSVHNGKTTTVKYYLNENRWWIKGSQPE